MNSVYNRKSRWKLFLMIAAMFIVALSLLVTNYIVKKLAEGEKRQVELVMEAYKGQTGEQEYSIDFETGDSIPIEKPYGLYLQILQSNKTIPVIVTNASKTNADFHINYFADGEEVDASFLRKEIRRFETEGQVPMELNNYGVINYVYHDESRMLKALRYYPYAQLFLVLLFIVVGYYAFHEARREEQDLVWVGMAKETAHQLGTPISAMVAWIEHLRMMREGDEEVEEVLVELQKDIDRLDLIADRFSKIGAIPELTTVDIVDSVEKSMSYMQRRAPRKVQFIFPTGISHKILGQINIHLFEWVLENLLRNALDAMGNKGTIEAAIFEDADYSYIDISDSGKGIPTNKFKTVFQPGFSTKKRGWGLGLSLAKRIIEKYHYGKIFVKESIIDEGTTFRIQLPKNIKH